MTREEHYVASEAELWRAEEFERLGKYQRAEHAAIRAKIHAMLAGVTKEVATGAAQLQNTAVGEPE